MNRTAEPQKDMEFIDKKEFDRVVRGLQEDLMALQIKVGELESLTLNNDETRASYTKLVSEQAEAALRQRKGEER